MTVSEPSNVGKCEHANWIHKVAAHFRTSECINWQPVKSSAPVARAEPSRGAPDAAHTPGPWVVFDNDRIMPESLSMLLAEVRFTHIPSGKANAALIAQAPMLLAENEKLRAGHVVLLEALRMAKTRLGICHGRMSACIQAHEVSAQELPDWIAEAEAAIQQAERT